MPLTVNVAEAIPAETVNAALPSVAAPSVKFTVPVGNAEPLEAFTSAVSAVLAFWAKVGGLAATVVVVETVAAVTVTAAEAVDPLNLLSPP